MNSNQQLRQQIRQQVRARRQQLSESQQQQAAGLLAEQLFPYLIKQQAQHVALYLAFDGELNTMPLIEQLWQQQIQVYLPCLHPFARGHLQFLHYHPQTQMIRNSFNILQPKLDIRAIRPVEQLDVICTPLVAFDGKGNRLGMGGGFYDRTLAALKQRQLGSPQVTPTRILGLAHDCQFYLQLPIETWDQPIDAVFTPTQALFYA